jgi:ABC-type hemin transport system ATPase subunit
MRTRAMPRVGAQVIVAYLATQVPGTITELDDAGRALEVRLAGGERVRFALSRATGTFLATDPSNARLLFVPEPEAGGQAA